MAVVAEWLRRLTRNQFPSGSAGSNPADCEKRFFKMVKRFLGVQLNDIKGLVTILQCLCPPLPLQLVYQFP